MKFILIFAFGIIAQVSAAQNSLKLHANFLYANSGQLPKHYDHENAAFVYDHLSFGYRKEEGLGFHEAELKLLFKSEGRDNHRVTQFQSQVGYEFGRAFEKELFNVIRMRIGNQWRLFYLREDIDSREYDDFPVLEQQIGLWSGLFFHLEYDVTNRIYIDLNTCLLSGSVYWDAQRTSNPSLSTEQQKDSGINVDFLSERILRIGLGFRLGYMGGEDEEDEIQQEWDKRQKKKGKKKRRKKKR